VAAWLSASVVPLSAAPALLAAKISFDVNTRGTCEGLTDFQISTTGPTEIDHRLVIYDGTKVEAVTVSGAPAGYGPPRTIGRTLALTILLPHPGNHAYRIYYRVVQADPWASRCPVWVPSVPARARAVALTVHLPPGAAPLGDAFPAFVWDGGGRGTATLSNVPAFALVRFRAPGEPALVTDRITVRNLVDLAALAVLAIATTIWASLRKRP
jgi:hypothetical protein